MAPSLPTDLESLTAELVRLKDQGTGDVPRVILFGSGQHREGEPPYSREQVTQILTNFESLSTGDAPPLPVMIGLDHIPDGPAVGRVSRLWEEPGGVLACSFSELPSLWAKAIRHGLWFRVSADVDALPYGLPGEGLALVGATLLGSQRPQVKWTSHLQNLVRYAEKRPGSPAPAWRYSFDRTATGVRLYAEAKPMAASGLRAALEKYVKRDNPTLTDEFIASQSDDQLVALSEQATAGADTGGTTETATDGAAFDRAAAIEEILATDPAQDRAALEAMSDDELKALWQEKTGKTMSGTGYAETETTPAPVPAAVARTGTPAAPAVNTDAVAKEIADKAMAEVTRRYAELKRSQIDPAVAAVKAETEANRKRSYAEAVRSKNERVDRTYDELLDLGLRTPADEDDAGGTRMTERQLLKALDFQSTVHSYAEKSGQQVKLTALDVALARLQAEIDRAPGRRKYGEGIRQDRGGNSGRIDYAALRKETADNYAARNAPSTNPLRQRLGMLPPAHQR